MRAVAVMCVGEKEIARMPPPPPRPALLLLPVGPSADRIDSAEHHVAKAPVSSSEPQRAEIRGHIIRGVRGVRGVRGGRTRERELGRGGRDRETERQRERER